MKQLSLIILMWFSTLYLNAQQKFDIELFPINDTFYKCTNKLSYSIQK